MPEAGIQAHLAAAAEASARGAKAEAAQHLSLAIERHQRTKEPLPRSCYFELGVLLYDLKRFDEAESRARQGLERQPKNFGLHNLLGVLLKNMGRYPEALRSFETAQKLDPRNISPLVNKGNVYLALRDGPKAIEAFTRVVRAEPRNSEYQRLLGNAYRHAGDTGRALAQYEQARRVNPRERRAWVDAAGVLYELGRLDEATELLRSAIATLGADEELAGALLQVLRRSGRRDQALATARALAALHPGQAWVEAQIAKCLFDVDRRTANEHMRAALDLDPDNPHYLVELAESLDRTRGADEGRNIEAAYHLARRRVARGGNLVEDARTLRNILHRACDFEAAEGLGSFERLGDFWSASGQISALHYHMAQVKTPEQRRLLVDYHRRWGRMVMASAARTPIAAPAVRSERAKVRVGLMSSDLRHHPVSYFVLPLIEGYDRDRFEFHCYSWCSHEEDAVQRHIAARVDRFHLAPDISDRDAAQLIANDDLDILFELGGTTDMNKLNVMAWRPSRLQGSWLGYPHSSGLECIDYLLVDPYIRPEDPALLIEKPFELERSWVVLGRLGFNDTIPIEPGTPEERTGHVTFGTMNNPYKYNRQTLAAWAEAMRSVEGSRFHFVRPEGATAPFRDNVRAIFEEHGVAGDRIDFTPVRGSHMQHYNAIDIALDTFPQTGGTTTCETLWMGVPTVSLVGDAFFERLSYSNLSNAGLGDLCAFDVPGYVRVAVDLARDQSRRQALRHTLRQRIREHPLGRADLFVEDFQNAVMRAIEGPRP